MHPSKEMSKIIDGKRYNVATATLIASDEYWDGSNHERQGRNTFLYRTRGGAYFSVHYTQWQGERDNIVALTREEAMDLYENLPEREVDYEEAFDVVVEEAAGRPTFYDEPMKQTAVWLPESMITWLKSHNGKNMSEVMRDLIEKAMQN